MNDLIQIMGRALGPIFALPLPVRLSIFGAAGALLFGGGAELLRNATRPLPPPTPVEASKVINTESGQAAEGVADKRITGHRRSRHLETTSSAPTTVSATGEVKSENQTGGITAGAIGSVTQNGSSSPKP